MSGDSDDKDHEAALYKTYVQPLRVPSWGAQPAPPPAEPEPAARPEPVSPEPVPEPASGPPAVADVPPPVPPSAPPAKDFEFRTAAQAKRRSRVFVRAAGALVVAVGLALAYPIVHPFGSSSGSSLTQYLGRVQPLVQRASLDRKSVQAAVNAVRSNPKGRAQAERRLVAANSDRRALIRELGSLGTAPILARALPARLTSLLRSQIQTALVWQRWMGRHPFVYLKHDATTRNRIQALLHSQQASKGAFARLYAQLTRAAGLPLSGGI